MVEGILVFYFPAHAYHSIDDLAETIKIPANCLSSTVNNSLKDNIKFVSLNPYTVTRILSNQISLEILI